MIIADPYFRFITVKELPLLYLEVDPLNTYEMDEKMGVDLDDCVYYRVFS